jgi:dTDP-4-dehydrorhamnose 3,5-epimerase
VLLSEENKKQFYVPEGFAHGFAVLTDSATFAYKCTRLYDPKDEGGLLWCDPEIGIDWHIPEGVGILLSEKDKVHPRLSDLDFSF